MMAACAKRSMIQGPLSISYIVRGSGSASGNSPARAASVSTWGQGP